MFVKGFLLTMRIYAHKNMPYQIAAIARQKAKDGKKRDAGTIAQSSYRKRRRKRAKYISGNLGNVSFSIGAGRSRTR